MESNLGIRQLLFQLFYYHHSSLNLSFSSCNGLIELGSLLSKPKGGTVEFSLLFRNCYCQCVHLLAQSRDCLLALNNCCFGLHLESKVRPFPAYVRNRRMHLLQFSHVGSTLIFESAV